MCHLEVSKSAMNRPSLNSPPDLPLDVRSRVAAAVVADAAHRLKPAAAETRRGQEQHEGGCPGQSVVRKAKPSRAF